MATPGREIPAAIKRQLRQEAGFGCCVCGNPIYDYHHIVPYAEARGHDPAEMMLLCPNHHREATVGALPEAEQRRWKSSPENIARGVVDGLLKVNERTIAVRLGTLDLVGPGFKLAVDESPLLSLTKDPEGRLAVSMDLYDQEDQLLLSIAENEWISGDPLPWDLEFGHNRLKLSRKLGDIVVAIDARTRPMSLRGQFWRKNQCFRADQEGLEFVGVVPGIRFRHIAFVGGILRAETANRLLRLQPDPSLGPGAGALIGGGTPEIRIQKCEEYLERLPAAKKAAERGA